MKKVYVFFCFLLCNAAVFAQTSYTDVAVATAWNTARWNNAADGPLYTSLYTANNNVSFTSGTYTIGGMGASTNVGNVTVASGVTVNFVAGSTYATGGLVRTIDVGSGGLFDFNAQALSTAAGTGFIKNGPGVLGTGGGNFTAGFVLNAGTVIARGTTGFGSGGTNFLTLNGGTIAANASRSFANTRFPAGITIGGNVQFGEIPANVALASNTANLQFDNNVSLGAANRTLTLGNASINTFTGIISNTSGGITIAANANGGTGSFVFSGANTYSGGTAINGGTLTCGLANTIPAASAITLGGGTLKTGTAAGFSQSTGTLNLTANSTITLGTGVHTLSFANSSAVGWTAGQMITITGWTGGYNGTSGLTGQIFVGTDATGLTVGQLALIQFFNGVTNFPASILSTGEVVAGVVGGVPDIALSSPNPAVAAGNILQGSTSATNNPIYRFDLAVTTSAATLTGVTITTAGSYAVTDITNFKCWYSSDAIFSPLTDILLSTNLAPAVAGVQVFPSFTNQVIASGATGYIFITADVPCTAVVGNDISVNAIAIADLSFLSGNVTGSAFAGGLQTITGATPNNVNAPAASVGNASSTLTWGNPAGCYDAVLIVAATATNTGVPTGDGTAYTGNLAYPGGTALGNGFVAYNGPSTSGQVVTGLTNGTPYFYKFFTRKGTTWTAGVEVSATPAVVSSTTDYFRSLTPGGNWNSTATWESSADNITWIAATLVPTALANTITIRSTADVTVNATAGGDQIVVDAGATLTFNANFTLADGPGTDMDVNGTVVNSAGTMTFTGTSSFNAGSVYQHNRNGGAAPTASWNINSLFEVTGATSAAPTNITQTLGNFTWNSNTTTTTNLVGTLTAVAGNFRVQNSGTAALRLTGTADLNLVVGGNFIIEDDLDIDNNATGVCNISIGGNFVQTAGAFGSSVDIATITMTGVNKTYTQSGGTFAGINVDWIINAGASITLNNSLPLGNAARTMTINGTLDCTTLSVNGTGAITVTNGGRAKVGSLNAAGAVADNLSASAGLTLNTGSTIEFNGLGAQFAAPRTFSNLTINNAAGVTLTGIVVVNDILNLTVGNITTTPVNLLTMAAGSSVGSVSNTSFVNGPCAKLGNTDFTFPVGKTNCGPSGAVNGYAAITISNSAGGTAADQYTAEYMRGSGYGLGAITAIGLNHISACDYWILDQDAGTSTLDVTLSWSDPINNCTTASPYVNNLPSLVVAHHDGATWDTYGAAGTALGTNASGTVTWPGVSVFSPFIIGSVDFTNPLPITINYFNGTKNNGNHLLNWKVTCVSSPSANIELERSTDGISYSSIYSIFATAVRCQQPFDYTDNVPAKGVNYYRIKMTDATGKVTYSSIVSLINATKGIDIMNIAPNPIVNGNFNIKISTAEKVQMELVITDMQGRILQKQSVNTIAGFNSVPVNVRSLAAGTYQLFGTGADGRTRVLRFVIQ